MQLEVDGGRGLLKVILCSNGMSNTDSFCLHLCQNSPETGLLGAVLHQVLFVFPSCSELLP